MGETNACMRKKSIIQPIDMPTKKINQFHIIFGIENRHFRGKKANKLFNQVNLVLVF